MHAAEGVIHEVKGDCMLMILKFFRKCIRESRKAAHAHTHREILPLNVTCRNVPALRMALNHGRHCADALRWTVASLWPARLISVQFDQHRVINFCSEREANSLKVNFVPVSGKLNAIREAGGQIVHKVLRVPRIAVANSPAGNQLSIGANCRPRPDVAVAKLAAQFFGNILFLRVAERPDFVALNFCARKIAESLVLIFGACLPDPSKQFRYGVLCNARHADGGANRISLNDCGLAFGWEVIHAS